MRPTLPAPGEDGDERLPRRPRVLERAVHQPQAAADELLHLGTEPQVARLRVLEDAQQPERVLVEHVACLRIDHPVLAEETVEMLDADRACR